ncbi:MAG TPA: NADPH-dependent assimilatory sulfite reductase hemoprotein subunit [Oligoflexus sp.]|uniref:NADPH-dependent assimilatory sulfite reductase hemoprotein subunit n=1 Tax=Oligoflexus sp. TaxID=1971216 RepID=UPI002D7E679A|nr:NADPH-dependent assimilatory sulfite reductase hemoprotein subunit [Oligoflexus sp.]HET9241776.1 NADPH-dependent assimilatory sulfite reductase hemoprotein subunit [Oligoflexus sp.]
MSQEKSKMEVLKEESRGLRGTLPEEINSDATRFTGSAENLLKFHGMYQYKDRDKKKPGDESAGPKPFTMMVRGRIPGGRLTWQQWVAWDDIASRYATAGLRITTRQSLQLHGVLKGDVKPVLKEVHEALMSTTGACGDVVRNVTQSVNPWGDPRLAQLDEPATRLSKHFEVGSNAYFEIFLDGEPVVEEKEDRIYGKTYLPRKFKIGLTAAGNNSIDIYTQDLGLAATFDHHDKLDGYFVFVGGGMGMSHNDTETHPRLADLLGWIPKEALVAVAEGVVFTQRDYGNRENRTFARLKYLLDTRGLDWFKNQVEERAQLKFEDRPLPAWKTPQHLGWIETRDGTLALGFHTLSGRLIDAERPLKSALRHVIETYQLAVQLTAEQDLILHGIKPEHKREIETYLDTQGLNPLSPRKLYDRALTCVALPTCMKALAESERVGPHVFGQIQEILDRYQLNDKAPIVRITGCPNGCARPYSAEIGIVGQMPGLYAIFVGGEPEGQRLAFKVKDKVKTNDLPVVFDKLIGYWKAEGGREEFLGDFVQRVGAERLGAVL